MAKNPQAFVHNCIPDAVPQSRMVKRLCLQDEPQKKDPAKQWDSDANWSDLQMLLWGASSFLHGTSCMSKLQMFLSDGDVVNLTPNLCAQGDQLEFS